MPQINVKKVCTAKKKPAKQTKKPAIVEICSTFTIWFSIFSSCFNLVQRAFCGGSILFLEINLLHN